MMYGNNNNTWNVDADFQYHGRYCRHYFHYYGWLPMVLDGVVGIYDFNKRIGTNFSYSFMTDTNKECCQSCGGKMSPDYTSCEICPCHQKKECPDGCDGSKIYTNCPFHGKVATTHTNQTGWGELDKAIEQCIGVAGKMKEGRPYAGSYAAPREAFGKIINSLLSKEREEGKREALQDVQSHLRGMNRELLSPSLIMKSIEKHLEAALTHQQKEVW